MEALAAVATGSGRAAMVETHVSYVFLLGDRAYKLKKPVDLGFLDFRTRAAREADCRREVELNRRFAPDVYLGVADVLGPDGRPCDHLVVMRRLPDDRRLSTLVRAGADVDAGVRAVAHQLAGFHSRAESTAAISAHGTRDAVRANWTQSFEQLEPFLGHELEPGPARSVERLALRYLEGREALFERRIADGRVRDGHGDLLAEDIFLMPDGPRVLDCLEFAERYRYADVVADAAFLAMDLERLGVPALGRRFLAWYLDATGDNPAASLVEHYLAYRAHVRAKVAAIAGHGETAAGLMRLALSHLQRGRVRLVLAGGAPGTGKTTLAAGLSAELGLVLVSTDELRKDISGLPHPRPPSARAAAAAEALDAGIYSPAGVEQVYEEMLRRARRLLGLGESVVLDATWRRRGWREAAQRVAAATSADLVELRCEAPAEVCAERIAARNAAGGGSSDATPLVAQLLRTRFEPWPGARVIDTAQPFEASLRAAVAAAAGGGAGRAGGPAPSPSQGTRAAESPAVGVATGP